MKKNVLWVFLFLILLLPVISSAEEVSETSQDNPPVTNLEDQTQKTGKISPEEDFGFYGSLMLGAAWVTGKPSQLEVADDNRVTDDLNKQSGTESKFLPLPIPELGYVFRSTGTTVSFGGKKSFGSYGLTVSQPFEKIGTLSLRGSYGQKDVWKDPYLTDVKRKKTDRITLGAKLKWEEIFKTRLRVSYGYQNVDVKHDEIGDRYQNLKRDGDIHEASLGYAIPFSRGNILIPSVVAVREELTGESNSNNTVGIKIEHIFILKKVNFATSLSAGITEFDKIHPVYNKVRDQRGYSIMEFITFNEPFGLHSFSAHLLFSHNQVDSNIDFFDSSKMMIGLGVGYRF